MSQQPLADVLLLARRVRGWVALCLYEWAVFAGEDFGGRNGHDFLAHARMHGWGGSKCRDLSPTCPLLRNTAPNLLSLMHRRMQLCASTTPAAGTAHPAPLVAAGALLLPACPTLWTG